MKKIGVNIRQTDLELSLDTISQIDWSMEIKAIKIAPSLLRRGASILLDHPKLRNHVSWTFLINKTLTRNRVNICCNIFLYSCRLPYASFGVTFPSLLFTIQVTLHHASLPWFYSRNMWQLRPRTLRGQFPIERCGSNRPKRWYFFSPYFVLCINILMTYSLKIVCTVPEVNYAVLLIVTDPCFSRIYLVVIHLKNLPKCN